MTFKVFKIAAFLMLPLLGQAQFLQKVKNTIASEPRLVIKLDSRNSFITTDNAKIFGVKAGFKLTDDLEAGLGYSFLISRIIKDVPTPTAIEGVESFPARLKYRYLAFYAEYTFYKKDNWKFSAPFQVAAGRSFYKYRDESNKSVKIDKGPALSFEPGAEANYYIFPWLSFGLGIGYRIMLVNNPNIDERFSAPLYTIKLNIAPKPAIEQVKEWVGK